MQQLGGIVKATCLIMLPALQHAQQSCVKHSGCMQRTSRCQSAAADGVVWSVRAVLPMHDKESVPAGSSWSGIPAGVDTSV